MKLIATEIAENTVQLTYTDGPAVPEATNVLIVRRAFEFSPTKSFQWHHLRVLQDLLEDIEAEKRRIMIEIQKA